MIILITGASAGIGAAAARRFAKKGHELILAARRKDRLEALRKEIGKTARILQLDITSRAEVEKALGSIGPVDVLINNAGAALGLDKAQDSRLDDWEAMIDLNIKGTLYCTHALLPAMIRNNKGHIVNLGSTAGTYPYAGGGVYCGSKAFIRQFSLSLRADLLGTNVRVSCIEPGLVGNTEFSNIRFKGDASKANSLYENTRPLSPEDVAETIFFCVNAPEHVNFNSIEMMPVSQASAPLAVFRDIR